jgi:hypothetical protein
MKAQGEASRTLERKSSIKHPTFFPWVFFTSSDPGSETQQNPIQVRETDVKQVVPCTLYIVQ